MNFILYHVIWLFGSVGHIAEIWSISRKKNVIREQQRCRSACASAPLLFAAQIV